MIIVMGLGSSREQLDVVVKGVETLGYKAHVLFGVERNVIACIGDERGKSQLQSLESYDGVERVVPILSSYKLAARQVSKETTVITVDGKVSFGGKTVPVIAGPCSVESEEQIVESAKAVLAGGGTLLRGGAYKPRSSTYSFQGLGEEGLKLLQVAKQETGLPIVTEVLDQRTLDVIVKYADVLQIGARNMQNFALLKAVGETRKPVLLKRGMMSTIEEFLQSAEYILAGGNPDVLLCERGIRTFETATRNTLDLNAIPALRDRTHLPIIIDPSHATGVWRYVNTMSKASVAAGCDGLIVEIHPCPEKALSDGAQSLKPEVFAQMMAELKPVATAVGREI